jgi:hypothetical protein
MDRRHGAVLAAPSPTPYARCLNRTHLDHVSRDMGDAIRVPRKLYEHLFVTLTVTSAMMAWS